MFNLFQKYIYYLLAESTSYTYPLLLSHLSCIFSNGIALHEKHFETDENFSCRADESMTQFYNITQSIDHFLFSSFCLEKKYRNSFFVNYSMLQLRYLQ